MQTTSTMEPCTTSVRRHEEADVSIRCVGSLLALAIAAAHVADQGGISSFTTPDWRGWGYRAIEVGAVLTASLLLWRRFARPAWLLGFAVATGPFVGYLLSRSVGVPGDSEDIGNWSDGVGTVSLVVELALIVLCMDMLRRATDRDAALP